MARSAPDPRQEWELTESLAVALATLPSELRRVCLRLRDETEAGAARDLGLPRHQVHRAVQRLRHHLAQAGIGQM